VQHRRRLVFDLSNVATFLARRSVRITSGLQRPKARIGAPDRARQELQRRYPIASGDPLTSISTAPQRHVVPNILTRCRRYAR
jgi:hypothetical protein